MKCLVCGKEFEGNACNICRFPVIDFPGDPEAGIRTLRPTIDAYKQEFAAKVNVGIVTYHWAFQEGTLTEEREECVPFGDVSMLLGQTTWLSNAFDTLSGREQVESHIYVEIRDEKHGPIRLDTLVYTPNVMDGEKQMLGISVDEDFTFCLHVQSDQGTMASSERFFLFD